MDMFPVRNISKKIDFMTAFKRLNHLGAPIGAGEHRMMMMMQVACVATWPAIAAFTKYTMDADKIEHHERLANVVPKSKFPYLQNPGAVQYAWGTPCTLWDFECAKNYRDKVNGESH